ncbi:MAG: hypothetical protein KDK78_01985 [Chlamydiia bacterium]|nr:hypothetical protein [Chlamydiia bacterium]
MDPTESAQINQQSNDRLPTLPSTAPVAGTLGPHEILRLTDASGNTALHRAVYECATGAIEVLLATMDLEGIQMRNREGKSAYRIAFEESEHCYCVQLLASYVTREDLDSIANGHLSDLITTYVLDQRFKVVADAWLELLSLEEITQIPNLLCRIAGQRPGTLFPDKDEATIKSRLKRIRERAKEAGGDAERLLLRSALMNLDFVVDSSSSIIIGEAIRRLSIEDLVSADKDGQTPIHNLALGGLDQLRAYIDRIRNEGSVRLSDIVLAKGPKGRNAIHLAILLGGAANFQTLLECVDAQGVKQQDASGRTAFDLAFGLVCPKSIGWRAKDAMDHESIVIGSLLPYQNYDDYHRLAAGKCHELLAHLINGGQLKSVQMDMIEKFPKEEFQKPLDDGTNLITLCSKLNRTEALGRILNRFREMPVKSSVED